MPWPAPSTPGGYRPHRRSHRGLRRLRGRGRDRAKRGHPGDAFGGDHPDPGQPHLGRLGHAGRHAPRPLGHRRGGVTGNLTLAGTLDLTAGTGFASGTYRLFDYGGSLSGAGLTLGAQPAHNLFAVDTATAGQVNLIVAQSQWWNGAGGSGKPNGGSGTWDAGTTANWTDAAGSTAQTWSQGSLATFGGTAGTVTVATATAPQAVGLEFVTSGYTLTGGPVTLASFAGAPLSRVLVDDGTAGGGTATVASALTGTQGLEKTGPGTLILSGANTYTGETEVTAGTLQLSGGGSLAGDVAVQAGAVLTGDPSGAGAGTIAGSVAVAAGAACTSSPARPPSAWAGR